MAKKNITMDRYRVNPGTRFKLSEIDPGESTLFDKGKGDKESGRAAVTELNGQLEALQEVLFAQRKHKVLVVLQAMDTGGKDGTISSVFEGVNPLGTRVASFAKPSSVELDHDYLWRVHQQVPAKGELVIFNRSHYEDVLVVRVENLVDESDWKLRYAHICDFERMLAETGTTILKFYLHISKDEQKERLEARLAEKAKHWKFRLGDLATRKKWDDYMDAFEDAISRTSTDYAPWYVVPANKKWYRDWVISNVLIDTLKKLDMRYPDAPEDLTGVVVD
jgi:PPK2 family polyphosphate:nucleotide phosphotransferase